MGPAADQIGDVPRPTEEAGRFPGTGEDRVDVRVTHFFARLEYNDSGHQTIVVVENRVIPGFERSAS
jgi:hypothetical protein